jgi:hypothetical protein
MKWWHAWRARRRAARLQELKDQLRRAQSTMEYYAASMEQECSSDHWYGRHAAYSEARDEEKWLLSAIGKLELPEAKVVQ